MSDVLLWRGDASWSNEFTDAQDLVEAISEDYGGLGRWWGTEQLARFYGHTDSVPPSGGERRYSGAVLAVYWPREAIQGDLETMTVTSQNEGVLVPPGTEGRLDHAEVWTAQGWKRLGGPGMQVQAAGPSWRGMTTQPVWTWYEACIMTNVAGRTRSYEVYVGGMQVASRHSLDEAKAVVDNEYGPQQWERITMPKVEVEHYHYGPTTEFTEPTTIYVINEISRLLPLRQEEANRRVLQAQGRSSAGLDVPSVQGDRYIRAQEALGEGGPREATRDSSTPLAEQDAEQVRHYAPAIRRDGREARRSMRDLWPGSRETLGARSRSRDDAVPGTPVRELQRSDRVAGRLAEGLASSTEVSHSFEVTASTSQVTRGLVMNPSRALVNKIVAGTVSVNDFIKELSVEGIGNYWADPNEMDEPPESYAYAEELAKGYLDEGDNTGEISVILVAERPDRYGAELAEDEYQGDAYVPDDTPLRMIEVRYDAGWGWKTLPARGITVHATLGVDRILPTHGMFCRGNVTLDPRVFDGDELKADLRKAILYTIEQFWTPRYGDWEDWAKVYICGSAASYWWDSDGDLDILIGINKPVLDEARPQNVGVSEADVCAHLSREFKDELDPLTTNFNDTGLDATFFVNTRSYVVTDLMPYAAYNVTDNDWAVRPPKLPADWGPQNFPEHQWRDADDIADRIDEIMMTHEPERTEEGAILFDQLHELRQRAYAPGGLGWMDWGNFLWQALSQWGVLQKLYHLKHPLKTAATAWQRRPYGWLSADREVFLERGAPMSGMGTSAFQVWFRAKPEEFSKDEFGYYGPSSTDPIRPLSEITGGDDGDDAYIHLYDSGSLAEGKETAEHGRQKRQASKTAIEAKQWERITYKEEGAKRSVTKHYEVIADMGKMMLLRPVDKHGEDQSFYRADGVLVDQQQLLDKALILKRIPMRMDNHYGELVPDEGHTAASPPKLTDYCKVCGERIQRNGVGARWRHARPQPSGEAWDHVAQPGGSKTARMGHEAEYDYRGRHQPTEEGPPLDNLLEGDWMPPDIYEHPEYATGYTERSWIAEIKRVINHYRGKPNEAVTIYRAAPPGQHTINHGDWISMSIGYARQHAVSNGEGDWVVYEASVPAHSVRYAMDDLLEWGYWGPDAPAKIATGGRPMFASMTREAEYEYRRQHQPLKTAPLHDLTQANGEDIYEHPEWFAGDPTSPQFRQSVKAYRSVRNQPNAQVTIYRAAPKGITAINHGDWVTLSEAYARMHAMQGDDPKDDWPVYAATVKVGDVWWDGSEINEFGYWGPDAPAHIV